MEIFLVDFNNSKIFLLLPGVTEIVTFSMSVGLGIGPNNKYHSQFLLHCDNKRKCLDILLVYNLSKLKKILSVKLSGQVTIEKSMGQFELKPMFGGIIRQSRN